MGVSMPGVVMMGLLYGGMAGYFLSFWFNLVLCGAAAYWAFANKKHLQSRVRFLTQRGFAPSEFYDEDFDYRNLKKGVALPSTFLVTTLIASVFFAISHSAWAQVGVGIQSFVQTYIVR